MIRKYSLYIAFLLLAGCAGMSPEAKLEQGYSSASAGVKTTTVLVDRDKISTKDAEDVSTMAKGAKSTLDNGKDKLAACRAAEASSGNVSNSKCTAAFSTIDLGSDVLLRLEQYLKEMDKQ